ncbi:MAG TPA: ATP-grasp domain-containing protein [Methylomusa anaerophila]|uniref:Alanine-anticapsin ligase BacD n=1 Tax=Methylomusa anaerophila TaxID=1930071 RepID=A0A348AE78_9FIRM|nr:ATP-grasp domain-containing protein [Methylomusa anaerophila]BBB89376.1 alanine-anticapsin ligase BacD [Methylomusa anaerophila]HML90452.1 ATP-grasp domain-containing protein [Methylomusa anaerophila]
MAHILMVESWVGASGNLLPPLLKSLGHTYTFVTRKPEHYKSALNTEKHAVFQYADSVLVTETNDLSGLIEFLKPYQFDGIITVCDYYIEIVKEIAKTFNLPCPFPDKVKTVRQKHLLRQALDRAGLANPQYRLAHSWAEVEKAANEIGYPLVIKPVDLASSAFVRFIRNVEELQDAYHALEAFPYNFRDQERDCTYLLEEYMRGEEVSIESVSYNGETTILGITDKSITGSPYFIESGHMFPAPLNDKTRSMVTEFVWDVLKAVGFDHGIAHTEVKITAEGPRVVEINPRTAGNYIVELIERVTGINLLHAFIDLSLGIKPAISAKDSGITSAAIMFLVPPQGGRITEIQGGESLATDEHIARYKIENCVGKNIDSPIDNACYLGHIIAQDAEGLNARFYAEEALKRIVFNFNDKG